MGDKEHNGYQHSYDGKNKQEGLRQFGIGPGFVIIAEEIYHQCDSSHHDSYLHQQDDWMDVGKYEDVVKLKI